MAVTVAELATRLGAPLSDPGAQGDAIVTGVTHDSRLVGAGWLFCCVTGEAFDGHDFAAVAAEAGASALLVERELPGLQVAQIVVPEVRSAMGPASAHVFDHPARSLTTVGITGTNGKTTVANLLKVIFDRAGWRNDVVGTLTGARTTPEAPELQAHIGNLRESGVQALAMEVSSHALSMQRVNGITFDVGVFTNLSQDHLDFHGSMENYFEAKAALFTPAMAKVGVINVDDPYGQRLAADTEIQVVPYSLSDAQDLVIDGPISRFVWRGQPITLQLSGSYNVSNAIAAATAAECLGIDPIDIADALCAADPPRGRFELVNLGQPFVVAVDYAHTPDALEAVLVAAREVAGKRRVIVVFGCGGDRDPSKRPLMGVAAEAGSDLAVVTSDNPRSEDPEAIIAAIVAGLKAPEAAVVRVDRTSAISAALSAANPGDVVIIAGKGHETTQTTGDEVIEFDDRKVVIDWLRSNQ